MSILADLLDDCTPIEETHGVARIEWTEDFVTRECTPVIDWNENLRFHMGLIEKDETFEYSGFTEKVQERLKEYLTDDFDCLVSWSDWDAETEEVDGKEIEYPYITIQVWPILNHPLDQEEEEAFGFLWPAIAVLINLTDPGTWNCPYLFSGLAVKKDDAHWDYEV